MKINKLIIALILLLIANAMLVYSDQCSIVDRAACSSTGVLSLYGLTNSHMSSLGQLNTLYDLCCDLPGLSVYVKDGCVSGETYLISMSGAASPTSSNQHAGDSVEYVNDVCLSSQSVNSCYISNDCGSDECLISISDSTVPYINAHTGDCNAYPTKVCCEFVLGTDAPKQFTITKLSDSSIILNWLPVESVNTYHVYYSSNAYSLDIMDTSALTADITKVVVEDDVSFTDNNFGDSLVRYYRVSAVNGVYEELNGTVLGKQTFELYGVADTGNIRDTENWIGLALDVDYTASSFMDLIPDVYRIHKLHRESGTFDLTSCDYNGACNDFSLQLGVGYSVEVGGSSAVTIVGDAILTPATLSLYGQESVNILDTENWISVPYSTTQHDAESLMAIIPGVFRIHKLVRSNDPYFSLISCDPLGACADNFMIEPGKGYTVEMSTDLDVAP